MTARDDSAKAEPFERAKLPMILAAVGVAGGLAIAGSVERTAGGAIVLGAWVLGIAALHRLGRAGSASREPATGNAPEPTAPTADEAVPDRSEAAPAADEGDEGKGD